MLQTVPLPSSTLHMLAEQLATAAWSWAGSWVRCSQLHGPQVLVIGDAAHAVSPSLGQGCNAALEDVTVIKQLLNAALANAVIDSNKQAGHLAGTRTCCRGGCGSGEGKGVEGEKQLTQLSGDSRVDRMWGSNVAMPSRAACESGCCDEKLLSAALRTLPESFTAARLPDVLALVWLDENARAFRGQMGLFNSCFIMYCAHMYCRPFLRRLAPLLISKPALQRVWESPVSYQHITSQLKMDGLLLMTVLAGLSATVAVTSLKYVLRSKAAACRCL